MKILVFMLISSFMLFGSCQNSSSIANNKTSCFRDKFEKFHVKKFDNLAKTDFAVFYDCLDNNKTDTELEIDVHLFKKQKDGLFEVYKLSENAVSDVDTLPQLVYNVFNGIRACSFNMHPKFKNSVSGFVGDRQDSIYAIIHY